MNFFKFDPSNLLLYLFLFILFFLPDLPPVRTKETPQIPKLKYTDKRISSLIAVGVTLFMGMALVQQTLPFRFQDTLELTAVETAQTFGLAMGVSAAASLAAQIFLMQRIDLPPFRWVLIALPCLIVAFLCMALGSERWILILAMAIQGGAMGLAGPAFMAGASLAVGPEEQGAVAGVMGSCGPLGFTLGPLVGGSLYQLNPDWPYWFTLIVYVPLFLYMLRAESRRQRTA